MIVSKEQYDEHYKLYRGYITKLQTLQSQPPKNPESIRGWSRDYNYTYAGARLHQLYFDHLNLPPMQNNNMLHVIKHYFKDISKWSKNLHDLAMTCRPGGWALTCYNTFEDTIINIAFDSHDGLIPDMVPLVVLDAYEHSYLIDYGVDKSAYFTKFIDNLNWDLIWSRYQEVSDK